jgi:hypothetical protein
MPPPRWRWFRTTDRAHGGGQACSEPEPGVRARPPSLTLRHHRHRAVRVMQRGVADPAELTEVAVPAPGPDDDKVRGRGAVREHLTGGPFDRRPVYPDAGVVHHRVAERGVEQFRCPLLVPPCRRGLQGWMSSTSGTGRRGVPGPPGP